MNMIMMFIVEYGRDMNEFETPLIVSCERGN
jgi:hypothetical protein